MDYDEQSMPREDTNIPIGASRTKDVAWQVESTLANDLLSNLGWWRMVEHKRNDEGTLLSVSVKWIPFGGDQLVSEYGANKVFMHLKIFLGKELPLTNWDEAIIKNTILNHLTTINEETHFDPNMNVKDQDLSAINEILKTIFREQAYKAMGGWTMEKIGEEKKIVVTERRDKNQGGFWANMPWTGKGGGNEGPQ